MTSAFIPVGSDRRGLGSEVPREHPVYKRYGHDAGSVVRYKVPT